MENFFRWMSKPIPEDEVVVWFSVNNMITEKIELFGDLFKTLYTVMSDTYLGEEGDETKIAMTQEDKLQHFEWCWKKTIENFNKEKIQIQEEGKHKDYFWEFFKDTYYNQQNQAVRETIPQFIDDLFNLKKPFAKSDLDILTELYKAIDKNIQY